MSKPTSTTRYWMLLPAGAESAGFPGLPLADCMSLTGAYHPLDASLMAGEVLDTDPFAAPFAEKIVDVRVTNSPGGYIVAERIPLHVVEITTYHVPVEDPDVMITVDRYSWSCMTCGLAVTGYQSRVAAEIIAMDHHGHPQAVMIRQRATSVVTTPPSGTPRVMDNAHIAQIAHAALQAYRHLEQGHEPIPWDALPQWRRASLVQGVELARAGAGPDRLHESWSAYLHAVGQDHTYRDVPWLALPEHEKAVGELFAVIAGKLGSLVLPDS